MKLPNIVDFNSPHVLNDDENDKDKDSVILFFKTGEIVQFPRDLVDIEEVKKTEQADAYMFSNENDKAQFIWAAVIFSFKRINDETVRCIDDEKFERKDYERFFELFDIKYEVVDDETVFLYGPTPFLADAVNYKVVGKKWFYGIIVFLKDNINLFERFLN